ncbi:hypothetical protein B0H14DRAFT_2641265 [Mycena olivaceomarginata]|nr:hypothetical protein B0H14DRAFT_2641265 [Mycena olivaceomarginata]
MVHSSSKKLCTVSAARDRTSDSDATSVKVRFFLGSTLTRRDARSCLRTVQYYFSKKPTRYICTTTPEFISLTCLLIWVDKVNTSRKINEARATPVVDKDNSKWTIGSLTTGSYFYYLFRMVANSWRSWEIHNARATGDVDQANTSWKILLILTQVEKREMRLFQSRRTWGVEPPRLQYDTGSCLSVHRSNREKIVRQIIFWIQIGSSVMGKGDTGSRTPSITAMADGETHSAAAAVHLQYGSGIACRTSGCGAQSLSLVGKRRVVWTEMEKANKRRLSADAGSRTPLAAACIWVMVHEMQRRAEANLDLNYWIGLRPAAVRLNAAQKKKPISCNSGRRELNPEQLQYGTAVVSHTLIPLPRGFYRCITPTTLFFRAVASAVESHVAGILKRVHVQLIDVRMFPAPGLGLLVQG